MANPSASAFFWHMGAEGEQAFPSVRFGEMKPLIRLYVWMATLALLPAAGFHTFYMSTCEVRPAPGGLEVKVKLFADDLATAMGGGPLEASAVEQYMRGHLRFWLNGRQASMAWQGMERRDEALWVRFLLEDAPAVKRLKVENTLLLGAFEQQVNIVRLYLNGEKRFFNLDAQIRFEATEY